MHYLSFTDQVNAPCLCLLFCSAQIFEMLHRNDKTKCNKVSHESMMNCKASCIFIRKCIFTAVSF